jgi:hypothetical protein
MDLGLACDTQPCRVGETCTPIPPPKNDTCVQHKRIACTMHIPSGIATEEVYIHSVIARYSRGVI